MRRLTALVLVLLLLTTTAGHAASPPVPLAAHKALYAMTLDKARGDVVAARGTMGYEVIDACDGWAVRQRLDMMVTNSEGQTVEMVSDYATWEAKNGKRLRFHMKQTTDEAISSQTDGDAVLDGPGGSGAAHYTSPKRMTKQLPAGTLFPMAHTEAIIQAARAGRKVLQLPLFDGTSENGAEDSAIIITHRDGPLPTPWPVLSRLPSFRVHLAFFDAASKDMLPDYQVGMRYWDNGVGDDMEMDFGDFVMHAKMTEFVPQPKKC